MLPHRLLLQQISDPMFKIVLASLTLICGCGRQPQAPAAHPLPIHPASVMQCDRLYVKVVNIQIINELNPALTTEPDDHIIAFQVMNDYNAQTGMEDNFYRHCTTHMTGEQVSCAMNATTLEQMNLCE